VLLSPRRRRLRRELRALSRLLFGYVGLAYLLVPAWWRYHERGDVQQGVPTITRTASGIPGDPLNICLIGTREEVIRALIEASWNPADPITWHSSLGICHSVLLGRPYPSAPVSNLYVWERRQDLAFEQLVGKTARRRHHVRFWHSPEAQSDGRYLWLGAATFDRDVGISRRTGQITHHIDADVDAERDKLLGDLQAAGQLARIHKMPGIGWTLHGRNGGGDRYYTDGERRVGVLVEIGD